MSAPRKPLFIALILLMAFIQSPLAIIPLAHAAEGDYTGEHWPTDDETADPRGITTDGSNFWILDNADKEVYKYSMEMVYTTEHWDISGLTSMYGITTDGSNIWILDYSNKIVHKYNMTGYHISQWSTAAQESYMMAVCTDGNFIWTFGNGGDEVYKYTMDGTYTTEHFDSGLADDCQGITTDGSYIWLADYIDDKFYKFEMDGTPVNSWDVSSETIWPMGITVYGSFIYILELVAPKEVFQYEGPTPPTGVEHKGIVPSDSTIDDEQWFFLNASIEVLEDTSTFLFNRIDIDPDGLNLSCSYTNATNTFAEENDPNNYLQLDIVTSTKTDLNNTFLRVDYYLRIHSNVTKEGAYNVTVYSTASGDLSDSDDYTSVFTLTIRSPSAPSLLFGVGFNATAPYVELHWTHELLIFTLFEVQNSTDKNSWDYLGQNTTAEYHDFEVVNGTERYYKVRTCRNTGVGWKNSTFTDINFETVYFVEAVGVGNGDGAALRPEGWVLTLMIAAIGVPLIILGTIRGRR